MVWAILVGVLLVAAIVLFAAPLERRHDPTHAEGTAALKHAVETARRMNEQG